MDVRDENKGVLSVDSNVCSLEDSVDDNSVDQDRKKKRSMSIEEMAKFIVALAVLEDLVAHHLERSDMQLKIYH